MTQAERERAADYLTRTRENLLRSTRGLSPSQMEFKPAPGRWSVAECLEHIAAVENNFLDRMSSALREPPNRSKRSAFDGRDNEFMELVADRRAPRQAPDAVQPSHRWPVDRLLPEFEAARKRSIELASDEKLDLKRHFSSHRAFGELDCYQWLLLIGAHGERHRAQIEEVMATSNFPSR